MALTPTDNEAFFREVDENLRRDQMTGLAQRWGKLAIALIVVALALLAAFLWWRNHRAEQAGVEGEQLTAVLSDLEAGRAKADDPRLAALASSPRDGYRAMARLMQAAITAGDDPSAASTSYRAIADDSALPQAARDLAMVRSTMLGFDTLAANEVVARMKPLAVAGGPWFGTAGELTAAAYLKMNRKDLAAPLYVAIAQDPSVPGTIRDRAASMATALGQVIAPTASLAAPKE